MRILYTSSIFTLIATIFFTCGKPGESGPSPIFTKADSLTDRYLSLQDTLHKHWNIMINDDNQKIKSMHHLLHELMVTHPEDTEIYTSFEQRLEQLSRMRYTQKSMTNADVIEEYDFASNSLIIELIAAAESKREYSYNITLQKLVDNILVSDQRVNNYRQEYDSIAHIFNAFLERNKDYLLETDHHLMVEKKPVFQTTLP